MDTQITLFFKYKTIDSSLLSSNIIIVDDIENSKPAITLPLIHNNKAMVYMTNKKNEETLFVLVKEEGQLVVRCTKQMYLRIDD